MYYFNHMIINYCNYKNYFRKINKLIKVLYKIKIHIRFNCLYNFVKFSIHNCLLKSRGGNRSCRPTRAYDLDWPI